MKQDNKVEPVVPIVEDKPYGWVFEGRFFKEENDMRGITMSEGNVPVPVYDSPVDKEDKISKAIEFAEWILKCEYYADSGDWWDKAYTGQAVRLSTKELYEIFNQSLK